MNVLVVPTSRPEHLGHFLRAWYPWPWARIVVVEDGPEVTCGPGDLAVDAGDEDRLLVYSWKEIDRSLPEAWIISRRDSAIRSFGFWKAWELGADYIFTLDDDCFPLAEAGLLRTEDFVERHISNISSTPVWQSTVGDLRVRGLPYANTGTLDNVRLSVGLWLGHPDVDAIQSLAHGPAPVSDVLRRGLSSRVMPADQYFPMSGMNLAFRRDVACLMYFPPMGSGSPYGRFDDIWCGLVLQRIFRHLRYAIVCGEPFVDHKRASDPFVNLVKEAPGIGANEYIWELVDGVELHGEDPLTCMFETGIAMERLGGRDEYVGMWGSAIQEWCNLFRETER